MPDAVCLVIVLVDGDGELLGRKLVHLGEELPCPVDGVMLEIVAEAEVAEHLEESVVACGIAYVLKVIVLAAGAYALLGGGGSRIAAFFLAEINILELIHSRVGEKQRGIIVRHQRAGLNHCVSLGLEEVKVRRADLRSGHEHRYFFNDRPRAGQLRFEIEILPSGNRREFCGRHYARPRVPCPRRETVRAVRDALMAALTAREIIAK